MTTANDSTENLENGNVLKNSLDTTSVSSSIQKLTIKQMLKMLLAEVIGTALLVFFGCMGCIDWIQVPGFPSLGPLSIPLNFGLTVMFVIQIFGHISFAILNPAVAIAAFVNKLIDFKMCILYIVAETAGAALGMSILYLVTPSDLFGTGENEPGLCMTVPHSSYSLVQAFFVEFVLTSTLVLVVCGVWHPENHSLGDSAPLRIGLAVAAICIAGGPATGASINPARSFGPALLHWEWDHHWLYWLSPMSAGLVSSVFYRYVYI